GSRTPTSRTTPTRRVKKPSPIRFRVEAVIRAGSRRCFVAPCTRPATLTACPSGRSGTCTGCPCCPPAPPRCWSPPPAPRAPPPPPPRPPTDAGPGRRQPRQVAEHRQAPPAGQGRVVGPLHRRVPHRQQPVPQVGHQGPIVLQHPGGEPVHHVGHQRHQV